MSCVDPPFGWKHAEHTDAHEYILPAIIGQVKELSCENEKPLRILDIGCGNGYVASKLAELGHLVIGVDSSPDGVEIARSAFPHVQFEVCSVYDDELVNLVDGLLDCVVSLEVVEHLLYPKKLFERSERLLRRGGYLIISTPYHGYSKNLAISLVKWMGSTFPSRSRWRTYQILLQKDACADGLQCGIQESALYRPRPTSMVMEVDDYGRRKIRDVSLRQCQPLMLISSF